MRSYNFQKMIPKRKKKQNWMWMFYPVISVWNLIFWLVSMSLNILIWILKFPTRIFGGSVPIDDFPETHQSEKKRKDSFSLRKSQDGNKKGRDRSDSHLKTKANKSEESKEDKDQTEEEKKEEIISSKPTKMEIKRKFSVENSEIPEQKPEKTTQSPNKSSERSPEPGNMNPGEFSNFSGPPVAKVMENQNRKEWRDLAEVANISLLQAASEGDLRAVEKLVEGEKIDVNFVDYDKRSPLHLAASEGHLEVVKYLVQKV